MAQSRGLSASPRYRRRTPSPRRRRSRSRTRSRDRRRRSRSRSRRRTRSRTRSRSHDRRQGRRSRTRSPRRRPSPRRSPRRSPPRRSSPRRSPPRRASPRRASPRRSPPRRVSPRRSPPRVASPRRISPKRISQPPTSQQYLSRTSPPRRRSPEHRSPPHVLDRLQSRDDRHDYPRGERHQDYRSSMSRTSPPPYNRPRSRSPIRDVPPRHISPPRQPATPSWTDREKWPQRRESPHTNRMAAVMLGLHQQKPVKAVSPPAPSPPRRDSRSYRRSPSPRGYNRREDYRGRRSPVRSDDRHRSNRSVESFHQSRHSDIAASGPPPKMLLSDRFKDEYSDRQIIIDENITVDIRRKVTGVPVNTINRKYNGEMVSIVRRKDEGIKEIFDREELRDVTYPEEDEVETRVIKVVKRDPPRYYDDRYRSTGSASQYPRGADEGVRVELRMGRARSPEPRRDDRQFHRSPERGSGSRYESRDVRDRLGDPRISSDRSRKPSDLRNSLNKRREDTSRERDRRISSDSRDFRKPVGTRFTVTGIRDRLGDRGRGRTRSGESSTLPDFSRRPDKFRYEEWMDKPEMVPKGISYFEHDNRGDLDHWARRGRGRGRGRGFRARGGSYKMYSSRNPDSSGGKWQHDKYREVESTSEDNKPTSTTVESK